MRDRLLRPQRAAAADMPAILSLIDNAAAWLRTKDTDQWAEPWPTEADRNSRIRAALHQGKTWICWDHETPTATITADPDDDPHWPQDMRGQPAIYIHRLVVGRRYAGIRLGATLLDWAGRVGRHYHGARWVRISAWTTNSALHSYYRRLGFQDCGLHVDRAYPSRARFQKPTAIIPAAAPGLFVASD